MMHRLALVSVAAAFCVASAGCGADDSPELFDGTPAPPLPAQIRELDGAAMTRGRLIGAVDPSPRARSCEDASGAPVGRSRFVERVSPDGASITFSRGARVYGCDQIADPGGSRGLLANTPWCGTSAGTREDGALTDPRLRLCAARREGLTAFVWVDPPPGVRWVVLREGAARHVYEPLGGLPVRVSTIRGLDMEGSVVLTLEEYAADGHKLREYELRAAVAG